MRTTTGDRSSEHGAALVFVLLVMLALVALAQAVLASSLGELAASRAGLRHLEARAAAEAAVASLLRQPSASWMDSVPVGGSYVADTLPLGGAIGIGAWRRLGSEAWLVEGTGRAGARATARHARLAWSMDPLARVRSVGAVLTTGPTATLALLGPVDASDPAGGGPPLDPAGCAPWRAELAAHYASSPLAVAASLPDTLTGPSLGLIDFAGLLAAGEISVAGVGTPAPEDQLGTCSIEEPWVWGDPDRPNAPCGPYLPLRTAVGDLVVVGGVGQGVLVVDGDLTLAGGARLYGLVISRGALRVESGAVLEGLALARGGAAVSADARVVGSACWAVRALAAQRSVLGALRLVPGVGAVGPL